MTRFALFGMVVLVSGLACSDSSGPGSGLAGEYSATTFTATESGGSPTDVLAAGGSLTITLAADGGTSGMLFVPSSVTGADDLSASMVGTYTAASDTVRFSQAVDTFVRDMPFAVTAVGLEGQRTFGSTLVHVILTKQ